MVMVKCKDLFYKVHHVLKQIVVFSVVTNLAATNRMLQTLQNVHQCNYHMRFVSLTTI